MNLTFCRRALYRYRAKYSLLRLLHGRGWRKDRIIQLLRVIDWLMTLPPEWEQRLWRRIAAIEGTDTMQYVTSFERLAKQESRQKGHLEGRQEGGRELLLRLLERRFGALPETVERQVRDATPEQLNA